MTLQEQLNHYMKTHCLTTEKTARKIGISATQVSTIKLHNKYSPVIAEKIYKALGEDYREYFEYSVCSYCGIKYLPRDNQQQTCLSDECKRAHTAKTVKEYNKKLHSGEYVMKTCSERGPKRKKYVVHESETPKQSIPEFMSGKQYGDRQREYLLNIQKTQRMVAK